MMEDIDDDSPPHLSRICKCGNKFDQVPPPDDSGIIELKCGICRLDGE